MQIYIYRRKTICSRHELKHGGGMFWPWEVQYLVSPYLGMYSSRTIWWSMTYPKKPYRFADGV
ncbi:hypothetical protein RHGRI_005973 [Rhododendron griersonianum]|uniref:Uncharacterized protein n=1 Tax=Rhododendron griersonianum TaxID=479676 RepID=A0AAV6LGW6_9ERIC|nr:hypothetical protein RHGRI_005973 [Rhododendron griersonianum]